MPAPKRSSKRSTTSRTSRRGVHSNQKEITVAKKAKKVGAKKAARKVAPKKGAKRATSGEGRRGRAPSFAGQILTITEKGKSARRREGTRRSETFAALKNGKPYEASVAAGAAPSDIAILVRMGHVKFSGGGSAGATRSVSRSAAGGAKRGGRKASAPQPVESSEDVSTQ